MKRQIFKLLAFAGIALAATVSSCKKDSNNQPKINTPAANNTSTTTEARAVTWNLVWADEFNGTSVDGSKWNVDVGNPNVNNEKEYYQASNATVTGGNLVITARNQSVGGQPY